MKKRILLPATHVLFALLLTQLAGVAAAQQPSQAQANAIRQSCRSDYQSYCSSVPTGGTASLQCLQGHLNELSPPCQTAVSSASGGGPSSGGPSSGGSARPPSAGAPAAAPYSAPKPMSPREKMAIMRQSCGGDFRAYCRGVPLGGGEAMRCLSENQSRLSPACQSAMAESRGAR
jgi:Cysteine rich repeat